MCVASKGIWGFGEEIKVFLLLHKPLILMEDQQLQLESQNGCALNPNFLRSGTGGTQVLYCHMCLINVPACLVLFESSGFYFHSISAGC